MAIIPPNKIERQKKLIFIFIITLLIAIIIWVQGTYEMFSLKTFKTYITPQTPSFSKEQIIEIDFKKLDNPVFKKFKPYEKINPFEGEIKRENPFQPY